MDFGEWKLKTKLHLEKYDELNLEDVSESLEPSDEDLSIFESFLPSLFPRQVQVLLLRLPNESVYSTLSLRNHEYFHKQKYFFGNNDGKGLEQFEKGRLLRHYLRNYPKHDSRKLDMERMSMQYIEKKCMCLLDKQKQRIMKWMKNKEKKGSKEKEQPPNTTYRRGRRNRRENPEDRNRFHYLKEALYKLEKLRTSTLKKILQPYIRKSRGEVHNTTRKYMCDILASMLHERPSCFERRKIEKESMDEMVKNKQDYSFLQFFSGKPNEIFIPKDIIHIVLEYLPKDVALLNSVGLLNHMFYLTVLESWRSVKQFSFKTWTLIETPLLVLSNIRSIMFPEHKSKDHYRYYERSYRTRFLDVDDRKYLQRYCRSLRKIEFGGIVQASFFLSAVFKKKFESVECIHLSVTAGWYRKRLQCEEDQLARLKFKSFPNVKRIIFEVIGDLLIWEKDACQEFKQKDKSGFFKFASKLKIINSIKMVEFRNINQFITSDLKLKSLSPQFKCVKEGTVDVIKWKEETVWKGYRERRTVKKKNVVKKYNAFFERVKDGKVPKPRRVYQNYWEGSSQKNDEKLMAQQAMFMLQSGNCNFQ